MIDPPPGLIATRWDETADAVIIMDLEGRIVEWSPAAAGLFGWSREEAVGRLVASLLVPDRLRDAFSAGLEQIKSGEPTPGQVPHQRLELTSLHQCGEEIVIDLFVTHLQLPGKSFFLGQARNLSFRRRLEAASSRQLVESQLQNQATALSSMEDSLSESLQKSLDTLCSITGWPIGLALVPDREDRLLCTTNIWHASQDHRLAAIRPESFQIKAKRDEGFVGQIWHTGEPTWTSELDGKDPLLPAEFTKLGFQSAFGFPVVADEETIAVLVFFAWGEMNPAPQMLMVINNLRQQLGRMVERKLWIEERARLAAIVDSSYDAIIGKDLKGRIIAWNQGAEQIYGYAAEEVLGEPVRMLLPEGMEEEEPSVTDVLATGHRLKLFETKRRCKNGSIVDVALTVSPIRNSRGRIIGSSSIERDVTLRKKRDRELRQAKREAEKANQAKTEFLANISHELRTPMNAILGMLTLSLGEELTEVMRDYLTTAHESAQTLLYLLNDLLDFSRMTAGHMELESEPFRLRETLDMAMKSLSLRASEKGLELVCHINPRVPNTFRGDAMRLRQIIINLAGNAIKFTQQGEVVVTVGLGSKRGNEVSLEFSVKDTGIGVPKSDRDRIFSPFTQVDASTTRVETGSGLGLAIVRELVENMGGTIGVDSELGRGSNFHFTIPLEVLPDARLSHRIEELIDLPVLVVDDNRTNQVILAETLSGWSIRPTVVGSAKAALKKIGEAEEAGQPYQLMIVDALMPEMDGFMLIEQIHQQPNGSAGPMLVLMLSSADRQTFKQRCENLDVSAYLEKPISQSVLLDTLMTLLKGPPLSRDSFEQVRTVPLGLSILVAEDTPANQKVIRAILEKRGHLVQIANNGREAVDWVKQGRFDVVLMDVQMPTMDGMQATQTIRQLSKPSQSEIPIVAMTAHARREDRRRCLAAGMDAYIAKPIDAAKLVQLVESVKRRPEEKSSSESWEDFPPVVSSPTHVNVDSALARMGGNETLVTELAQFFLEDVPQLVKDISRALKAGHAEAVERAAHSLKGLAANFDAETLATVALSIEQHGRNGDLEQAAAQHGDLRKAAGDVIQELQAYLDAAG